MTMTWCARVFGASSKITLGGALSPKLTDGKDAVAQAIATKPDVAILDYRLPLIDGIEATRQIRRRVPKVEVLIFTMHDDESLLREALSAGARGYVLKSDAGQHLISAVQSLAEHKPYFTDRASQVLLENFLTEADKVKQILTGREQVVVQLVAEGHSNKEAAAVLNVSIKTVETHRATDHAQARPHLLGGIGALRRSQQFGSGIRNPVRSRPTHRLPRQRAGGTTALSQATMRECVCINPVGQGCH